MMLRPKGWDKFQHYKDRCPPWIKLHRDLLINRDFMCLPIASKALAPMLWLLASEAKDGIFDASFEELQFRLHISEKDYQDGVKSLIDKGFFEITSGVLAERKQVAIPETEGETEKRQRQKEPAALPDWLDKETWSALIDMRKRIKKPMTDHAQKLMIGKLLKMKQSGHDIKAIMEKTIVNSWLDVYEPKGVQAVSRNSYESLL